MRKILFYRQETRKGEKDLEDFLFSPKDATLRQDFSVIVANRPSQLEEYLEKDHPCAILIYLNLDFGRTIFNRRALKLLKEVNIDKFILHNTDPFSRSRHSIGWLTNEIKPTAILCVDPMFESYQDLGETPVFFWPWSVDLNDFEQITVKKGLFVSVRNSNRPGYYIWRRKFGPILESCFETKVVCNDVGWKEYQKMLTSCAYSYTCGSCTNTVVNKHLEIPASQTVMFTEETPLLKMMGFVDGENCYFLRDETGGMGKDLRDIPRLKDKELAIAGFRLIHDRHQHCNRKIVKWLCDAISKGEDLLLWFQESPFITPERGLNKRDRSWIQEMRPRDLCQIDECYLLFEQKSLSALEERIAFLRENLRENHPDLEFAVLDIFLKSNGKALGQFVHKAIQYYLLGGLLSSALIVFDGRFVYWCERVDTHYLLRDYHRLFQFISENRSIHGEIAVLRAVAALFSFCIISRRISIRSFLGHSKRLFRLG